MINVVSESNLRDRSKDRPLAIYVHWPFCLARCPYCDFNAHVATQSDIEHDYVAALVSELSWHSGRIGRSCVGSIFFGGGTPSLMQPQSVAAIIDAIAKQHELAPGAEVTLEANPTSADVDKFKGFQVAGVNRISIGVQSLRDKDLKFLGRQHDSASAKRAIKAARKVFDRVSIDLIYSRYAEQTPTDWRIELNEGIDLAGGHISAYALTIEPNTHFATMAARGELPLADADTQAEMLYATHDTCASAGYMSYEISNFAEVGEECAHNLSYWRYQDFLGIGAGAHSRVSVNGQREARVCIRSPRGWLSSVTKQGHGTKDVEVLTNDQEALERLLNCLRLSEGCDLDELRHSNKLVPDENIVSALVNEGILRRERQRVWLGRKGIVVADGVVREIAKSLVPVAT